MNKWNTHAGYATAVGPRVNWEADTLTCQHCNRVYVIAASRGSTDPGGWCRLCMAPICSPCVGKPCVPLEKQIEKMEADAAWAAQYDRVAGG